MKGWSDQGVSHVQCLETRYYLAIHYMWLLRDQNRYGSMCDCGPSAETPRSKGVMLDHFVEGHPESTDRLDLRMR